MYNVLSAQSMGRGHRGEGTGPGIRALPSRRTAASVVFPAGIPTMAQKKAAGLCRPAAFRFVRCL